MPGSFTFQPQGQQIAYDAIGVRTYLYDSSGEDDGGEDDSNYTLLPNIHCEQVQYKEGAEPPTARFSYVLDAVAAAANNWPDQFEDLWPLQGAVDPAYVVTTDDELVVLGGMPDGTTRVLFHGYARVPQTDLTPDRQAVTFVAVGVAIRCFDYPLGGCLMRTGINPNSTEEEDQVWTDLPMRFNPSGTGTRVIGGYLPNCTPANYDFKPPNQDQDNQDDDVMYPCFLDPNIDRDPDPRTLWNLSGVVRFILGTWNQQGEDSDIDNPNFYDLDTLLQNRRPLQGSETYDLEDPSTYTTDPNIIRDYDATNKPWPEAVSELLDFYGFGMAFVCEDDDNGEPYDYVNIYRKDAAAPTAPKQIYLPPSGTAITDGMVNVAAMHAAFDFHGVANDVFIETALERFEVSVILAPGFQPVAGDDTNAGNAFSLTALDATGATATQRKMYRYYIADECGDGHFSIENQQWVDSNNSNDDIAIDFTSVFQDPDDEDDPLAPPAYVPRYRPGKAKVFSKDLLNLPRKAQLAVSRNYAGADPPCVWDTVSGTDWREIDGWQLLTDRLGIMVTADNPQTWKVGDAKAGSDDICPGGVLRGITGMSNPNNAPDAPVQSKQFYLRLTTVIEGDFGIDVEAERRYASPIQHTIQRRVDAKDHFHYDVIDASSAFNPNFARDVVQDDTDLATAHACQIRSAHEFPPLTAAITIPMFCYTYCVGDRINQINGRDVSFQCNATVEQGELPAYPFVVAVTWDFSGDKQSTTLQLADRRTEPRLH